MFGTQNAAAGLFLGQLAFLSFQQPAWQAVAHRQANNGLTQLLITSQADEPVDLGKTTGLKVKL